LEPKLQPWLAHSCSVQKDQLREQQMDRTAELRFFKFAKQGLKRNSYQTGNLIEVKARSEEQMT
jgi:hypothetical protein